MITWQKNINTFQTWTNLVLSQNLKSELLNLPSLKYGLVQSFIDKNNYFKRNFAVEMESLVVRLDKHVNVSMKKNFMTS